MKEIQKTDKLGILLNLLADFSYLSAITGVVWGKNVGLARLKFKVYYTNR